MTEETKQMPKRVPNPQKRAKQDLKKQQRNKIAKSRVRTALRSFQEHLPEKNSEFLTKDLNTIYALVDKAVKNNIFKSNKGDRIKSRYAKHMQKALSN